MKEGAEDRDIKDSVGTWGRMCTGEEIRKEDAAETHGKIQEERERKYRACQGCSPSG